jgi:3-hydroxyacyl-[acyl-carrier-protein] dehydratase
VRFILVDRIIEIERGRSARGIKNVSMTEDFLTHHFPGTPIMPGALIAEASIQLAEWLVREATDFKKSALPASLERASFFEIVRPGDQLELDIKVIEMTDEAASFSSLVSCRGKRVAKGKFKAVLVPTEELEAIAEVRHMFSLLYMPSTKNPLASVKEDVA